MIIMKAAATQHAFMIEYNLQNVEYQVCNNMSASVAEPSVAAQCTKREIIVEVVGVKSREITVI